MKCMKVNCGNDAVTRTGHCAAHALKFPKLSATHENPIVAYDEHEGCKKQILFLEQKCGELATKFEHLQQIYNKLADQWNVFQATNRPDNRNIQRAEGAGEMARKLAEVLLGVAYQTDVRSILKMFLEQQEGASGQDVEVSQSLVRRD